MKNYFEGVKNFEELRQAYKRLIRQYHPDLHQENKEEYTRIMAEIIKQYEDLEKVISRTTEGRKQSAEYRAINFTEVINQLINLDRLVIEIVGSWIWLSGNTYPHKEIIKKVGFQWSKKHKKWYMSPTEWDGKKTKLTLDQIKAKHGCERVGRPTLS